MPKPIFRPKGSNGAGYIGNIEMETWENSDFRKVLFTGPHSQLVVMSIPRGEDIGLEVHKDADQFIRVETGEGAVILGGEEHELHYGCAVVVPAGTPHNVINTGYGPLKLYTIYSPAHHQPGTLHETKEDAQKAEVVEHHTTHTK